ncbi:helix-turn-helix domain-containing protein [Desulfallas thermosapovorans]|uniref:Cytoskeletal protein RodZ n=1 Tax=Desulfallas thermosapovorans DSM 6562 TaxID=1121431 RepID=A0A5S4ZXX0_9FIRM|nr:RodZ domain-containing protein [Desulfallas thermosapovorans]TYO97862.1 cytoskeletal protein RodZ [Desulfallas thermosapovorans DSM 6562]
MSIGEELRRARELMGASLSDVENETKIRTKYLAAMENDAFDVLPGKVYVKGFLRNYARFLGLDGEALVNLYEEQFAPRSVEEKEHEMPDQLPRNNKPPGWWKGLAAGAVVLLAFITIYRVGGPVFNPPEDNITGSGQPPGISDTKGEPANDHSQAPGSNEDGTEDDATGETQGVDMVLHVTGGESWMQVVVDNENVFEGLVGPNNVKEFAGREKIWLKLGNAGVVKVRVNGKDYGFLDGPGQVVTRTFTEKDDQQTAGG